MRVETRPLLGVMVLAAMLGVAGPALAQRDAGTVSPGTRGAGSGPMHGYGMHGYGMGPGMMGGGAMGPGMMGGYGMGPGMMGGWGMHPGMVGGWGMGSGMMDGGLGAFGMLDLSAAQRTKINGIADDLRKKHWALMGQIQDDEAKLRDLSAQPEPDPKAVGTVYVHMSKLRQQMIETRASAMDQARAVLTPEQRGQLDRWLLDSWGPPAPPAPGGQKQP